MTALSCTDVNQNPYQGAIEEILVDLTDEAGNLSDGQFITFTVLLPDGSEQEYVLGGADVLHVSTGIYKLFLPLPQYGQYVIHFSSSGDGISAQAEIGLIVKKPRIS